MENNLVYLNLFFLFLLLGCTSVHISLAEGDQNQIIKTVISIEKDSSFGLINSAKYGSRYLLNDQFHDSLFVDSNMILLIGKNSSFHKIQKQYKKEINENNKLTIDSFDLIHVIEFSNKTPVFLSFSKPIKYLNYYIIDFYYTSWSSGYKSALILEKSESGQFKLIYRKVYEVN